MVYNVLMINQPTTQVQDYPSDTSTFLRYLATLDLGTGTHEQDIQYHVMILRSYTAEQLIDYTDRLLSALDFDTAERLGLDATLRS